MTATSLREQSDEWRRAFDVMQKGNQRIIDDLRLRVWGWWGAARVLKRQRDEAVAKAEQLMLIQREAYSALRFEYLGRVGASQYSEFRFIEWLEVEYPAFANAISKKKAN